MKSKSSRRSLLHSFRSRRKCLPIVRILFTLFSLVSLYRMQVLFSNRLRVNSSKNVTEEGSFTHLEMLPAECRLLSLSSIGGLGVFPELFHSLVDGSS